MALCFCPLQMPHLQWTVSVFLAVLAVFNGQSLWLHIKIKVETRTW